MNLMIMENTIIIENFYIQSKNYQGTFEILFEDEDEKQTFEINKNINQNAEIVNKVINNDIGSTVTLKSGIKFKIISKNIN